MIKFPAWLPVVMVLVTACTDAPMPSAPVASARLTRQVTDSLQTTYVYDATDRLVSMQFSYMPRPRDPYSNNGGVRYSYDVPGQLRSKSIHASGDTISESTYPLNAKGFVIQTGNTYDAEGYFVKGKYSTRTVENGDVVKEVLQTPGTLQTVIRYLHDATRLNTLPDPTYFFKGTPDRHLLTGEIRETTYEPDGLSSYYKEVVSYTYVTDSQGRIIKRSASTLLTRTANPLATPDKTFVDKPIGTSVTHYYHE